MLAVRNFDFVPFQRVVDSLWPTSPEATCACERFSPATDVRETSEGYVIEVEVPGMTEKEIAVTLANGTLTLKGERKPDKDAAFTRQERAYGPFERIFRLPDDVDESRVEAKTKNGVLTLHLPKAERAKPKTISVVGE
jgi:HSP20 family protein